MTYSTYHFKTIDRKRTLQFKYKKSKINDMKCLIKESKRNELLQQ